MAFDPQLPPSSFAWEKLVFPDKTPVWCERVGDFVEPERLVIVTRVHRRTQSLQIYCETLDEARSFQDRFGGKIREITAKDWMMASTMLPRKPLSFAGRLLVTGNAGELEHLRALNPTRPVLCIPAAMAFGTGEHATTAMCLRLLCEIGSRLENAGPWSLLDLGSGSGILSLAGRIFGASAAVGLENDPHAVRCAKENAAMNTVRRVHFLKTDLLRPHWPAKTQGGWKVITANLFSELLIALLPQITARLNVGGSLIASGILASQAEEVLAAAHSQQLRIVTRRRRGRWVAFLAQRER